MYGTAVGTLNVYVKTGPGNGSDVEQLVWTNAGNQGNSWIQGQAPVFSSKPFRVSVFCIKNNKISFDIECYYQFHSLTSKSSSFTSLH